MVKKRNAETSRRGSVLTILDIGSAKTVCIIARMTPAEPGRYLNGRTHQPEVIGIGHTRSLGVKSGMLIDLQAAERSIRIAVEHAERMAGLTVDSMIINISAGRPSSSVCAASIALDQQPIEKRDMERVMREAVTRGHRSDRHTIHLLPTDHALDGVHGIADPRGMVGEELTLNMHQLTVDAAPIRNIELAVNRAHLSVETIVSTPYASGLATLVNDELELGCAVVDIGAGTTSFAVFNEGRFVHADYMPIGGHHVTLDLARGLSCGIDEAERLKTMHGSVVATGIDDTETIQLAAMGHDESGAGQQVPRSLVNRIISARVEETLEMLRDRINASGHSSIVGKRVVFTGGASQMSGLGEMARRVLGRNVRIGRPLGVKGLPASAKGPAFSCAVGLLVYPQTNDHDQSVHNYRHMSGGLATGTEGPLGRVTQWIKHSF
ncbi:MAG: cell division protein FtsA [Pseudomonadota bacterium]